MSTSRNVMSYREALTRSMKMIMDEKPESFVIGQGADDPTGIFGTTLGLKEKYGSRRVIDSPLCEESATGAAIGASLNGLYPIMTHIRVDFALLAMNQLINMAAKYKYMFGGAYKVPMLVRMVVGRSWGQGSQHSQSLQSLFGHIPGLHVIMPASAQSVLSSYSYAAKEIQGPVLSIEHRLLYDLDFDLDDEVSETPFSSRTVRKGKDLTVVASSIMVIEALQVAKHLSDNFDMECEVIDLHSVSHYDEKRILESVKRTGKLLVADTSWKSYGVCAEVSRLIAENCPHELKAPVRTIGMAPTPCPTAKKLENEFYPSFRRFAATAAELIADSSIEVGIDAEKSTVERYREFRGPF